jgi:periplasmic protein TonB
MLRLEGLVQAAPHLPPRRGLSAAEFAASGIFHLLAAGAIALAIGGGAGRKAVSAGAPDIPTPVKTTHFVFIARDPRPPGGGGGGGGNRQPGPIRHAEGIGRDAITLRVARPAVRVDNSVSHEVLPAVLLDARPLASGTHDVIGLPEGGVSFGTSQGPGSGGGVGEGSGSGIGPGTGPGVGPGSGGGIGGGVYRPGGSVSSPRVIVQVKPKYTTDAMMRKVQGTAVLEFVVRADGRPDGVHVVRSLDPGLDDEAVIAARQWRFEPGRLGGRPVDVLVTLLLDFSLH